MAERTHQHHLLKTLVFVFVLAAVTAATGDQAVQNVWEDYETLRPSLLRLQQEHTRLAQLPDEQRLALFDERLELLKNVARLDQLDLADEMLFDQLDACERSVLQFLGRCSFDVGNVHRNKDEWVCRMIDASGTILPRGRSGLFSGNNWSLGSYDDCLPIRVYNVTKEDVSFRGQYLLAKMIYGSSKKKNSAEDDEDFLLEIDMPGPDFFNPSALRIRADSDADADSRLPWQSEASSSEHHTHNDYGVDWEKYGIKSHLAQDYILATLINRPHVGLCVPSVCPAEKIASAIAPVVNVWLKARLNNTEPFDFEFVINDYQYMEKDQIEITAGDIVAITVLSIFFILIAAGTIMDVLSNKNEQCRSKSNRSLLSRFILCFSLCYNCSKLISTESHAGNIGCINGIRVISMTWVILGHTFFVGTLKIPWMNPFAILDMYSTFPMSFVWNAVFAVDTFFLMSGFLLSYLLIKELDKTNGRFNVLMFYVNRYLRLTPLVGVVILVFSTLALHFGSGPFWHHMVEEGEHCARDWWANLLYINNWVNPRSRCLPVSWYLSVDFQLFLLSPLLVWPMWKLKRRGIYLGLVALVVSCAIPGIITAIKKAPPMNGITISQKNWQTDFYEQPHTRAQPYIWGIIFGYILQRIPHYHRVTGKKIPWFVLAAGWLASAFLCLAPLLSVLDVYQIRFDCPDNPDCYSVPFATFYASCARLAWGVGVSWVIFACYTGYGGLVDTFLSWPFFIPLSRATFGTYLVHQHVMFLFHFSMKAVMYFDLKFMFFLFCAHWILSMFLGFTCTLFFESPFVGIQKLFLPKKRGTSGVKVKNEEVTVCKNASGSDAIANGSGRNGKVESKKDTL